MYRKVIFLKIKNLFIKDFNLEIEYFNTIYSAIKINIYD